MIWVWSKLSSVKWMDAWEERFYGNQNAVITLMKGGANLRVEVYNETQEEAEKLRQYWGGSVRKIAQENWVAKSAVVKPPLKIRSEIVVTMEGDGPKLDQLRKDFSDRLVISVPPEMAFGTGDHPTTANCLRLLVDEAHRRKGTDWNFLDLGTGSGLLAIAARHLGALAIDAVDYDEAAILVARRNCERNGLSLEDESVKVEVGDVFEWEPARQAEVLIANLFSDVLIAAMPRIAKWLQAEGTLIVSGILNAQWPAVREAGEKEGLVFGEPVQRGKWTTAQGRHG
ncbi:50S ribosomal protein L11 methyltransferase [Roseibacillus persicicus]|uniref:50S ribosomal protein L11 methyltransferase n=1 Tax=Roseibacillus persicicus TaxID=454148 RepID=UPI0028108CD6|nr:50S ribosomal protein L11 methyltransferase [Roseibacillus persicicus]MDQ8188816.1 50S ribosomal protein L11 methyltransferase [Roseibacillus persicicus]